MKKLVAVAASLLVLAACGGSDGDAPDADTPTVTTTEPAGDADAGAGVPDVAYPPGAEVTELADGITQYKVANSTVDLAKLYWVGYFEALGFTKYNEANASVFYEKGSVKMQATYAQAGTDVRGTVKVLSQ